MLFGHHVRRSNWQFTSAVLGAVLIRCLLLAFAFSAGDLWMRLLWRLQR
jgi:hypothetical protein